MAYLAAALPVLPGQEERVRRFADEFREHEARYRELNEQAGITRHQVWLQPGPTGSLAIHLFESDDPSRMTRTFDDSPYDRWWIGYLRDVHGIEFRPGDAPASANELVFDWTR